MLSNTYFDSKTGRFTVASLENMDIGLLEKKKIRKRHFPKSQNFPTTTDTLTGKEFKQLVDPNDANSLYRKKVDEITKSCTDLAIDG